MYGTINIVPCKTMDPDFRAKLSRICWPGWRIKGTMGTKGHGFVVLVNIAIESW